MLSYDFEIYSSQGNDEHPPPTMAPSPCPKQQGVLVAQPLPAADPAAAAKPAADPAPAAEPQPATLQPAASQSPATMTADTACHTAVVLSGPTDEKTYDYGVKRVRGVWHAWKQALSEDGVKVSPS